MQRLVHIPGEFEIWTAALTQPSDFLSPFHGEEFNLLLIAGHTDWSEDQRRFFARLVIGQACRCVVSIGPDAQAWDRGFDHVAILEGEEDDEDVLTIRTDTPDEAVAMSLQVYGSGSVIRLLVAGIGQSEETMDSVVHAVLHEFSDHHRRDANIWIARTLRHIKDGGITGT